MSWEVLQGDVREKLRELPVKGFTVGPCRLHDIRELVEKHHYSKSVNGVNSKHCFSLKAGNHVIGGAIYAGLGMANVWEKYVESENELLELRRLVCIDEAPRNSESRLIGQSIRWLEKNTKVKKVISYADPYYGHEGTIYKAANFKYLGESSPGRVIKYSGKRYHDKTVRAKYKNNLKPFAARIKEALNTGEAAYEKVPGKYIYVYELKKRRQGLAGEGEQQTIFSI